MRRSLQLNKIPRQHMTLHSENEYRDKVIAILQ